MTSYGKHASIALLMFVFSGARPVYLATAIVPLLMTLQPVVLCTVDITTMNLLPIYNYTCYLGSA